MLNINNFKNHNLKLIKINSDTTLVFNCYWTCSNCNIKFKTFNEELTGYSFYIMEGNVNFLNSIESCDECIIKNIIK